MFKPILVLSSALVLVGCGGEQELPAAKDLDVSTKTTTNITAEIGRAHV